MKIIRTILFVILIGVIEVALIQGIIRNRLFYIDLLGIIAILASLKYGWVQSGCLAFGGGLLQDSLSGSPLGIGSISLAAGCLFSGSFRWILFSEHVSTRLVMVFFGSIIIILTRVAIEAMYSNSLSLYPAHFIFQTVLPTATINMMMAFLLYPFLSKYIFVEKTE